MAANETTKVRYFERQFLGAADMQADQQYHRDALRRHDLGPHTWGLIVGFELQEIPVPADPQAVDVVIMPGLAVDGYGRHLVCFHPTRLDPADFAAFHTEALQDVWIGYAEDTTRQLDSDWFDCADDGQPTRTVEGWSVRVTPVPPTDDGILVDGTPAAPASAPVSGRPTVADDRSVPYQEFPDGVGGGRWLLQLGSVVWDGVNRRFKPAGGSLARGRRHAGLVGAHLLAPSDTLRVARRTTPANVDAADFATVDGRLRVTGRINAEREVWVEGDPLRFTYDAGDQENVQLTMVRRRGSGAGHELRIRLGEPGAATTALSVGAGEAAAATEVLRVQADDVAVIRTGSLRFGSTTRQMIDLWSDGGHQYGLGVQPGTLYERTAGDVVWYRGGTHSNTARDAGAGGQLQMRLDTNGSLHFDDAGTRIRQMLNLWQESYGIGVQASTLYQRSGADFVWYRGGSHAPGRSETGGATMAMRLNDANHLQVFGDVSSSGRVVVGAGGDQEVRTRHVRGKQAGNDGLDRLFLNYDTGLDVVVGREGFNTSNLRVSGSLVVLGPDVSSVVTTRVYDMAVRNTAAGVATWSINIAGDFTGVPTAFAVLRGFSLFDNGGNLAFEGFGHVQDDRAIPQHVMVRVTQVTGSTISGRCFCSESDETLQSDNTVLFSVVAIGRKV